MALLYVRHAASEPDEVAVRLFAAGIEQSRIDRFIAQFAPAA